jgi:hypothetical protein
MVLNKVKENRNKNKNLLLNEWTQYEFKMPNFSLLALAYQGKDIVFRFIREYSSLRDFGT